MTPTTHPLTLFLQRTWAVVRLQCQRTPVSLVKVQVVFLVLSVLLAVQVGFNLSASALADFNVQIEETGSFFSAAGNISGLLLLPFYIAVLVFVQLFTIIARILYAFNYDELRDNRNLLFWVPSGPWPTTLGQLAVCSLWPILVSMLQALWLLTNIYLNLRLQIAFSDSPDLLVGQGSSVAEFNQELQAMFAEGIKDIVSSTGDILRQIWPTAMIAAAVSQFHYGTQNRTYVGRFWGGALLLVLIAAVLSSIFEEGLLNRLGTWTVSLLVNLLAPEIVAEGALQDRNMELSDAGQIVRWWVISLLAPVFIAWRLGWRPVVSAQKKG